MNIVIASSPFKFLRSSRVALWLWSAVVVTSVGCNNEPLIRQYTVPKETNVAGSDGRSSATEPRELLAAIVPKSEDAWFFKLMGDPDKISQYKDDFRQLVSSVSFAEDGKPKWQLPDKWSEGGGRQFVYASLRPSGDESLEVTVSPLAMPTQPDKLDEAAWRKYVLDNVNRWRGQLQLSDQSWDEMARGLEPIKDLSIEKAPAYFVSLRGQADSGGGAGMGPMSGSTAAALPPSVNGRSAPKEIKFELPSGWREVPPASVITLNTFEADGPESSKATITLTSASGDTESNVARWNAQVGGQAEQASAALKASEKLIVNDAPTEVVFVSGPDAGSQAIMAAMIQWDSQSTLFAKLMGPTPAVESQREAFMTFVKSLKW